MQQGGNRLSYLSLRGCRAFIKILRWPITTAIVYYRGSVILSQQIVDRIARATRESFRGVVTSVDDENMLDTCLIVPLVQIRTFLEARLKLHVKRTYQYTAAAPRTHGAACARIAQRIAASQ